MATAIRDGIWAVDRDQLISSVEPLENLIAAVNTGDRVVADLMVFFSVLAMFLGAIGIYGVMAHLVSQRIHEIGIRMALGASPVHVMRMVLNQGLKLALGGVVAGVLAALGATRLLATQLYQGTPTDPLTVISVPIQLVILSKTEFRDGTIEIESTGEPSPTAKTTAPRGFVGVAFRVNLDAAKDAAKYECFYLRPTNGRADDQVRRNHSTQYISHPDFPWFRLRKEFPEKYESYADVVPGEWTKLKIEVHGDKARLYVQGAPQPALVVNDLKQAQGKIALWVGTETIAHFANLRVSQ